MKTPIDRTIVFTFASHPMRNLSHRWTATLTFPPGSGEETVLPISICDGEGEKIESGLFEFAGLKLPVAHGKCEIAYRDFVKGKHSVPLWLYRPGIEPVAGGLSFA